MIMLRQRYLKRSLPLGEIEPLPLKTDLIGGSVVIPLYNENEYIYDTLHSVKCALKYSPQPVVTILVINEPAHVPDEAQQNNAELLESLRKNDGKYDGGLSLGSDLFFIDLTVKEIPEKFRNVGNARKCGFDAMIRASDGEMTEKDLIFFSLDADTLVSENYFAEAFRWYNKNSDKAGAVFHFEHRTEGVDNSTALAVMRYEYYLRDYAWKVRSCGSYFGYWTIGSAFLCTMRSYIRCGGMRRQAAGEDFYFLQALRKTGPVGTVPHCRVYPSGRVSKRVPFGTGPAVERQLAGEIQMLYNERIFELLKKFFAAAESSADSAAGDIMLWAPEKLREYLHSMDMENIWQKIVANTPRKPGALFNALQTFCDGFFILKFAHYLEEKYPTEFARQPLPPDTFIADELAQLRQRDCIERN